jgi:hypothetical protein
MIPNAPVPAPPQSPRTPERPGRHAGAADHLALAVLGEPLPCRCPGCLGRQAAWERERTDHLHLPESLPHAFWTRQAARLRSVGSRHAPRWRWAAVPVAGLLLAAVLLAPPTRSSGSRDDFEARWAEVQEALERPALGDLEACALLIDGEEPTTTEESL